MAPHDLARERASVPVLGLRSRVESGYEPSGRSAREALAGGGALGADGRGCPPFDGGAYRPGPGVSWKSRQRRCPDRRRALTDQRPGPV